MGDVSSVFELDGSYVVAMLSRVKESKDGYASYEAVREQAEAGALRDKKAAQLVASLAGGGNSLAEIAQAKGEGVQRAASVSFTSYAFGNVGYEPAAIGTAVALGKEGEMSAPVEGNNGVYVLQSEAVVTEAVDAEQLREGAQQTLRMRSGYEAYEALKLMSKVIDRRGKFF